MSEEGQSDQTLKSIAYIVSKHFGSKHIEELVQQFNNSRIPVQMHNDYDGLGVPLDRRYFVVVDNYEGSVGLGSWFSSLLLFIVGYPRKGNNRKNHYCTKPSEVTQKYNQFSKLPQFVKRNYLSSNISSKSFLKSARSSLFSGSNANSDSSTESKKLEQLTAKSVLKNKLGAVSEKGKLLMFFSQTDLSYNKWILKIAANNPKKYEIVETIEDLNLLLSVCRSQDNYLLITHREYFNNKDKLASLKTILYAAQQLDEGKNLENVVAICKSHNEIISTLRQIGFQVVSLKDIDKSIVRYRNPLAKNQIKPNKKILWGKDEGSDSANSCDKKEQKQDKSDSQYCLLINNQTITEDKMTASAPINCSFSSITKPEQQNTNSEKPKIQSNKSKKRISIDNGFTKDQAEAIKKSLSESERLLSSLKGPIIYKTHENINQVIKEFKKKDVKPPSYIIPVPIVNVLPPCQIISPGLSTPKDENQNMLSPTVVEKKSEKVRRIKSLIQKKIKNSQQSKTKKQNSIVRNSLPADMMQRNIEKQNQKRSRIKSIGNQQEVSISSSFANQILSQSLESKINIQGVNLTLSVAECRSLSQKDKQLKLRSISLNNQPIHTDKQNLQFQQYERIANSVKSSSQSQTYKLKLTNIQQSLLRKRQQSVKLNQMLIKQKRSVKQKLQDFVLLWKQFNYNIQFSRQYMARELKTKILRFRSFYTPEQLGTALSQQKRSNILIFLDEIDINSYFSTMGATLKNKDLVIIYIFEKKTKIKRDMLQKLQQVHKFNMGERVNVIVKPVRSNDYSDGSLEVAKQICSWFC